VHLAHDFQKQMRKSEEKRNEERIKEISEVKGKIIVKI
jgi:hypothetical protein